MNLKSIDPAMKAIVTKIEHHTHNIARTFIAMESMTPAEQEETIAYLASEGVLLARATASLFLAAQSHVDSDRAVNAAETN